MGKLRKKLNLDFSEAMVVSAWMTKKADVPILLGKKSNKQAFTAKVKGVVDKIFEVRNYPIKVTPVIGDIDLLANEDEVKTGIRKALEEK